MSDYQNEPHPGFSLHSRVEKIEDWMATHDRWAADRYADQLVEKQKVIHLLEALKELKDATTWQNRIIIATFLAVIGGLVARVLGWK